MDPDTDLLNWNEPCIPIDDDDDFLDDELLLPKHASVLHLTYNMYHESNDQNGNNAKKQEVATQQFSEASEVKLQPEHKQNLPLSTKKYIPGLPVKTPRFPSFSSISADEQALYLQLVKKFTVDRLPFLQRREQMEFQVFVNLHRRVQSEQRDFVNFARKQHKLEPINYEVMDPVCRSYIEAVLKSRQSIVPLKYHALYNYASAISLSRPTEDNPVEMVPVKELLSVGTVAFFKQPMFEKRVELPHTLESLERNYPSNGQLHTSLVEKMKPGEKYLYNTPVSEDSNASILAVLHGADIVVSSSVLQTLVDCHPNHPQNCAPPRDIPVVIRMVQGPNGQLQKTVFLDKVLPPVAMSLYDKKTWYCRRATKLLVCQRTERIYNFSTCQEVFHNRAMDSEESSRCEAAESNKKQEKTFEEELASYQQLQQAKDQKTANSDCVSVSKDEQFLLPLKKRCRLDVEDPSTEECCNKEEAREQGNQPGTKVDEPEEGELEDSPPEATTHNSAGQAVFPAPNRNLVYGLWSIHRKQTARLADSQWERSAEDVKLIIRTGYHAYELEKHTGNATLLHTSVKLEHQPQFGAQTSTVGEVAREWMSLFLRPNSILYRVRVDAATMEVIQTQRLTIREVLSEARHRQLNPTHCLGALHYIFSQLRRLDCGQYLLKLRPGEGWAEIIKQDTSGTKLRGGEQYFNLHIAYRRSDCHEGPSSRVPYSPIDTDLTTPYQLYFKRVPGTYNPSSSHDKEKRDRKKLLKLKKKAERALASQKKKERLQSTDPQTEKTDVKHQDSEYSDGSQPTTSPKLCDFFKFDSPPDSQDGEKLVIAEESKDGD